MISLVLGPTGMRHALRDHLAGGMVKTLCGVDIRPGEVDEADAKAITCSTCRAINKAQSNPKFSIGRRL